ncbi:MAG: RluA family pseudouridine synthase [Phycisphaeraceae bacterium]|nr:RluA family pseudouridine synthase [Phycisphaeraceae bacterium]
MPAEPDDFESEETDIDAEEAGGDVSSDGPDHRQFTIRNDIRSRLDRYLQNRLKGISRNKVQALIDLGGVTVNGKAPKASTVIRSGDVIDVILPPVASRRIEPEPIQLDVLYEDEHFIVLNKQANLIVHPARSNLSGTLINGLAYRFKQQVEERGGRYESRTTRGFQPAKSPRAEFEPSGDVEGLSSVGAQEFRPGIIHRLDKNTTGVIVVAKSDQAHWQIARQFEDRSTLKSYLAIVHGNFDEVGGAIEQPLGKHPTIREACAVRHDSAGKHALTLFRVREQYQGYSLVELELKTGRTHQIRVHLSYVGHPIIGDVLYGGEPIFHASLDEPPTPMAARRRFTTFAREKTEGQRIESDAAGRADLLIAHPALHAALLEFTHPITQQRVRFTAPLHEPMATIVRQLRKRPAPGPVVSEGFWLDLNAIAPER